MKKYRRTKNILEVYVPEAEGWERSASNNESITRGSTEGGRRSVSARHEKRA